MSNSKDPTIAFPRWRGMITAALGNANIPGKAFGRLRLERRRRGPDSRSRTPNNNAPPSTQSVQLVVSAARPPPPSLNSKTRPSRSHCIGMWKNRTGFNDDMGSARPDMPPTGPTPFVKRRFHFVAHRLTGHSKERQKIVYVNTRSKQKRRDGVALQGFSSKAKWGDRQAHHGCRLMPPAQ